MPPAAPVPRRRRDALENDERVLAAAVSAMLREGRQVPMAAIAAEAGVGVATLYRHYPDRETLLLALTERSMLLLETTAAHIVALDLSGWQQLDRWWDRLIDISDQLVLPLRGGPSTFTTAAAEARSRLHEHLRAILRAGRADGSLRRDVTLDDAIYFGTMLGTTFGGLVDRRRIARRQKLVHLAGLAGPAAPTGRSG